MIKLAAAVLLTLSASLGTAIAADTGVGFTRQLSTSGQMIGLFAEAAAAAGAPASVTSEAATALGFTLTPDRDLREGDHFYLRWEQGFTSDGQPTGQPHLLWAEFKTKAKGIVTLQRFQARNGEQQLFFANGQAAALPLIRLPLDAIKITSGFGPRPDPLDQPVVLPPPPPAPVAQAAPVEQPAPLRREDEKDIARAFAGVHLGGQPSSAPTSVPGGFDDPMTATINGVMARARARRLAEARHAAEQEAEAARQAAAPKPPPPPPPDPPQLFMHTGLDLLANSGTPVHAAADGVVVGAKPNGLYGNWVRIDHAGKLTTVYGHLLRFAPDIAPGTEVKRGDVIGYVGSTGRSTGAHLHFELLTGGHPVNPWGHPATKPSQLAGPDLVQLRHQFAGFLRERDLEHEAEETVALSLGAPMHPL
jgi:murein DD-endopeptidase MepM/ murein hydrolase activator NlpD